MNAKFLIVGTILGGFLLHLVFGVAHHLSDPMGPMSAFKNDQAVVEVLRANTDGNGVYFSSRGVLASVAFLPDYGDKMQNVSPNLLIQLGTDTLSALLMCLLLSGLRVRTVLGRAGWLALAGVAAFFLKVMPYWNWYGFSTSFVAMEAFSLVGKFFFVGLALAWLMKRFVPAERPSTA
jgi:hypothetical protein